MKLTHVRFIEADLLDHEPYELSNRKRDRRIANEFNSVKHLGNPDVEYIETKNRGTASETYLKNEHLKRERQRKKSYPKKSFCFYHIELGRVLPSYVTRVDLYTFHCKTMTWPKLPISVEFIIKQHNH